MDVIFLNYSDDRFGHKNGRFRNNQIALNESAIRHGARNVSEWTFNNLAETVFYEDNKQYLDKDRFDNGAAWKPYIVDDTLRKAKDGDIVFYCDCVPETLQYSIEPLVKLCIRNTGTLFQVYNEKNFKYTKRDAFVYMHCDAPKYYHTRQVASTWFLIQKNDFALELVKEWLRYNLDERIASYRKPNTCGLSNIEGFVENRGDQSILTNLIVKYGLKTYINGYDGLRCKSINAFIESTFYPYKLYVPLYRRMRKRIINTIGNRIGQALRSNNNL